jgi:hypothetical protein
MAAPTTVLAQDEDGSYANYDSLISQLEMQAAEPTPTIVHDDWDEVALHGGAGLIASHYSIDYHRPGQSLALSGLMTGFQLHFGVNLFSRKARVEGIFRNYASDYNTGGPGKGYTVDLKEFEFRGVYLPPINDKMRLRFGAGLSARYMNLDAEKASTPAASLVAGFERSLTPTVSFGPDFCYRTPLISDTFDRDSFDASLKLNAMF